jgi:hypothetical protein
MPGLPHFRWDPAEFYLCIAHQTVQHWGTNFRELFVMKRNGKGGNHLIKFKGDVIIEGSLVRAVRDVQNATRKKIDINLWPKLDQVASRRPGPPKWFNGILLASAK